MPQAGIGCSKNYCKRKFSHEETLGIVR